MAISVTNQRASQTLSGQAAKVTLDSSDSLTYLSEIAEGMPVQVQSSNVYGLVSRVDYYGNSFQVTPYMPTGDLSSASTPGYLAENEIVNIVNE
jgi:hypothetical protein